MSIKTNVQSWIQDRIPLNPDSLKELTNEPVPNHLKHWWFCLGGTPAYLFVVQIITGILLGFYYTSDPAKAYDSVRFITEEAPYGWYLRSIHKWAATLMIASIILHQIRIYFTASYRKPRELNWMIGCLILLCTLVIGFTGYSLVFEQLSYWGATVGANIASSVPVVGDFLKSFLLAGDSYNDKTLPRFFILHAAVLPVVLVGLLTIHIALIRIQGVTEFEFKVDAGKEKKSFNFFPDHLLTELIMGLTLMVLLTTLAIVFPADMGSKADPLITPEVIKPEWFFYAAFRWLKLFSATVAVLSMGFIVFIMIVWPFIDQWIVRKLKLKDFHVWIGIIGVLAIVGLTVWEGLVAH